MRALAAYVMQGRLQAILVAASMAVLSLLLPLLSYLSGATVALVTLRVGLRQGLVVILGAGVATGGLTLLTTGNPAPVLAFLFGLWLPVWILALSLKRTARLARSVLLAAMFGAALILGVHAGTENPAQWWFNLFEQMLREAAQQGATEGLPDMSGVLAEISRMMTGIMAAALTMTLIGSLLLGRWWQALLYNPGGFRQEFHELALGKIAAVVTAVLFLLDSLGADGALAISGDLLIVAGFLFTLQGIAIAHNLVARAGANRGWLIGMYVLLVLPMTMAQMLIVLAIAGFGDNFFNFRELLNKKSED